MVDGFAPLRILVPGIIIAIAVLSGQLLLGIIALALVRIMDVLVDIHQSIERLSATESSIAEPSGSRRLRRD